MDPTSTSFPCSWSKIVERNATDTDWSNWPSLPGSETGGSTDRTSKNEASTSDHSSRTKVAKEEWDFILPVVTIPIEYVPGEIQYSTAFSIVNLVGAVQHGVREQDVRDYSGYCGISKVSKPSTTR